MPTIKITQGTHTWAEIQDYQKKHKWMSIQEVIHELKATMPRMIIVRGREAQKAKKAAHKREKLARRTTYQVRARR